MDGLNDLLGSERGVFALLALFAATVLAALRVIDAATWTDFVKYVAAALIASKTVTGVVELHVNRPSPGTPGATQTPATKE